MLPFFSLIDIEFRKEYLLARALFNGSFSEHLLIDTGASMTHIPIGDPETLGINPPDGLSPIEANGSAGTYTIYQGRLDSFSLGHSLRIEEMPLKFYETELGFVRSNYLGNFVVTIDYHGGCLIMSR